MSIALMGLYWAVAIWGIFSKKRVLLWLFFTTLPFGSMAVLPPNLTGGFSLVPQTITAMLIVVRELSIKRKGPNAFVKLALHGPGLALFLFWCVGVIVTLFAPRFFAGQIEIVPMAVTRFMEIELLSPTKQNFSQLAYVTVSVFSVFAFARVFQDPARLNILPRGIMLSATVLIITGCLDFVSSFLPIAFLLEPFRTAQYALLTDATIADGVKRVTGLMPEASSFGNLTLFLLSLLWFLKRSIIGRAHQKRATLLLAGLAVMAVMSTSSAGYVGIGVLILMIGLEWCTRAVGLDRAMLQKRSVRTGFLFGISGIASFAVVLIAAPHLFDPIVERLNEMIFTKTESLSYMERSMWTRTTYQAGWSSHLLGVGLGSSRASNFAAAIFGSTGLLGFALYFGFVAKRLFTRLPTNDPYILSVSNALKWSFFPAFSVTLLVGTTPDFGATEALRWGILLALLLATRPYKNRTSTGHSAVSAPLGQLSMN